jgi:hypothetical protein
MPNIFRIKRGLLSTIPNGTVAEPLFTTDTYDLYVGKGDGTNQRFQKYIASGATTQIIRGDGSLYTFPLSITSPSNGQVLKYNGTSWVNSADTDTGITSLNGLTALSQTFAVGTSGTDFWISSATSTHTFNLPTASATNRGALSSTDWTTFNGKFNLPSLTAGSVLFSNGTTIAQDNANFFWDDTNNRLGIGTTSPSGTLNVKGDIISDTNINASGAFYNQIRKSRGTIASPTNIITGDDVGGFIGYGYEGGAYRSGAAFRFNAESVSAGAVAMDIRFFTGAGAPTLATERFRITAGGNLLISTTTDTGLYKLDVNGTTRLNGVTTIGTINAATTDTDKFLVSDSGVIKFRTGSQVLSDIGGQGALTLTTTGTSGAATLIGNTLNVPQYEAEGNYVTTATTLTINGTTYDLSANRSWSVGTVTSVGLSMPVAFSVSNTPITSSGTLAVTAVGTSSQYIRGDGQLATLPSGSSGGSSVNYYLNGSVAASVAGYQQMSNSAVIGAGTDFALVGNGLIAQFLTDVANPNRLLIPGGAWNFEMYFNVSSSGGNTKFYVELLKYDGTTFTSIASSSAVAEEITGGTTIDLYLTSLAVPETVLLTSDRLAIRVYIVDNSGGRTARLHTENSHLCEIITTFAGGIAALNGLTSNTQYLAVGTSGTDFAISSVTDTHTFNLPTASATNRGALSSADWSTFNSKQAAGNYITALTGEATATGPGSVSITLGNSAVIGKLLTGLNLGAGGTIVATDSILAAFGKVQNQISALVGGVMYKGTWNASTNSPTITSSVGNKGDYYIVSVAGSTNINGITDWKIGDWIIFNGSTWDKVDNTDSVSSVNGFTGAVNLTTANISEVTNLYYTEARVNANTNVAANTAARHNAVTIGTANGLSLSTQVLSLALASTSVTGALSSTDWNTFNGKQNAITLTTTGTSGAATLIGAILNIPQYQAAGTYVTSVTGTSPIVSSGGTTPAISIPAATTSVNGYLTSTDWTTFNSKQNAITLTTTGSSGSSTLVGATLNVPTYTLSGLGGVPTTRTITINGTAQDLSANRTFSVGTVTSVAALTLGTTGTDVSSSVANGTTTAVITLNIPTASAANRGALSSADWTTFNGKFNLPSLTAGSVLFSNGTTISQDNANFFWDDTNNRLGIGTTTPAYTIDITGSFRMLHNTNYPLLIVGRTSVRYATMTWDDPAGEGLFQTYARAFPLTFDASTVKFMSSGSIRMRIFETSGNILIQNGGTFTDAGFRLDVNGTGRFNGNLNVEGAAYPSLNVVGNTSTSGGGVKFFGTTTQFAEIFGEYESATNGQLILRTRKAGVITNALVIASTGAATFSSSANITGNLTVDTNTLFVDAANNNVGIGTASPSAGLQISSVSNNWLTLSGSRNGLSLSTFGLSLTETHSSSLVNGVSHYGIYATPTFNTTGSDLGLIAGAYIAPIETGFYNIVNAYGLYVKALTVSSGTVTNNYAAVFTGGNVGIGTTSPATKLSVITSAGGNTSGFSVGSSVGLLNIWGGAASGLVFDVTNGTLNGSTGTSWFFRQGGVTTMLLDATGAATFSSSVTASSLIKSGGTAAQILAANGTVITAGTNITISGGTISASGGGTVTGTGTTNYIPKWTSASALGNSNIQDSGTLVTISSTASEMLKINSSNASGGYISFYDGGAGVASSYIGAGAALISGLLVSDIGIASIGNVGVQVGGSGAFIINSLGGNTLIGTTTNDLVNKLQVLGGAKFTNAHLGAGTTTIAPLKFTAGVLKTTPAVGDMELDANGFLFYSKNSHRGVLPPVQWIANTATRTFVSNTNSQNMFDAGSAGANTFTAVANTTYIFEVQINLTGLSATANSVGFGLSLTGSVASNISYMAISERASTIGTPTASTMCRIAVTATTAVTSSVASATAAAITIKGIVRFTTGGSVTPVISQIGATAASVLGIGSYVKFQALGTNTETKNPSNGWA